MDYIKMYRGVLSPELCQHMISTYEKLWREQEELIKKMSICYNEEGVKTCGQCDCQRLDIMQHHEFREPFKQVISGFQSAIKQYKSDVNIQERQWPEKYNFENLRIKRFLCNEQQQHDTHVDCFNIETSRRFLAIVCYLNDNFDNGETEFLQHNIKTKVETGTVVLFPTAWTHLHRGNIATNGYAKYMLGSFLQYAQKQDMDRVGYKTMGLDKKGFG